MKKIFDGEFLADCTVIVFKWGKEYDAFVACNIDYNITIPKCKIHPLNEIKDYIKEHNQLIGYNNQFFDNPILEKIIRGMLSPELIYEYSQGLIKSKDRFRRDFKDHQLSFSYLDLLKINHYDNPARATSLKKLEFNYRRKKIMDLPFHHSLSVTKVAQLESVIRYCMEDVDTTEECYDKSKQAIIFRQSLSDKLDATNLSDVAIGEELNAIEYAKLSGIDIWELKKNKPKFDNLSIKFKDCIPDYIKFKTQILSDFLVELKSVVVNKTKGFEKKISYENNIIAYGQGGIHTVNNPGIIRADNNYCIMTIDVASQYPSNIIKRNLHPRHLSTIWSSNIRNTYLKRINEYKPNAKTDIKMASLSDAAKLQMNGGGLNKYHSSH